MQWTDPTYLARLIQGYDDVKFVSLCNDLLSETAARNGIDRSCLATNLHISEPDGGVDARCINAQFRVGRLIPHVIVAYQFKSGGQRKSAKKIAEDDILGKPRVRELLQRGRDKTGAGTTPRPSLQIPLLDRFCRPVNLRDCYWPTFCTGLQEVLKWPVPLTSLPRVMLRCGLRVSEVCALRILFL